MKCPICNKAMQEGGLIIDGVASGWVPMDQFQKRGLKRVWISGVRTIGKPNILLRQTKVPNAFSVSSVIKS